MFGSTLVEAEVGALLDAWAPDFPLSARVEPSPAPMPHVMHRPFPIMSGDRVVIHTICGYGICVGCALPISHDGLTWVHAT